MRKFGEISAEDMIPDSMPTVKATRAGGVTVALLQFATVVKFATPMPNANYHVAFGAQNSLAASLWYSNPTVNGFTLNVSVSVAGTISYIAVEE